VRIPAGFAQAQQLELAWAEGVDTLYKFRNSQQSEKITSAEGGLVVSVIYALF
jgi:hypothetical protein